MLKPTSTTFTKLTPPAPEEEKRTETDGKRVGFTQNLQANVYSRKLKELKDQIDEEVCQSFIVHKFVEVYIDRHRSFRQQQQHQHPRLKFA